MGELASFILQDVKRELVGLAFIWGCICFGLVPIIRARRAAEGDPDDGPHTGRRYVPKVLHKLIIGLLSLAAGVAFALLFDEVPIHAISSAMVGSLLSVYGAETIKGMRELGVTMSMVRDVVGGLRKQDGDE